MKSPKISIGFFFFFFSNFSFSPLRLALTRPCSLATATGTEKFFSAGSEDYGGDRPIGEVPKDRAPHDRRENRDRFVVCFAAM